jgi:superfamily II DNA or RNA helicase|tara:strand:- start:393 stop:1760 length:1368 start_codon:yes stop_codon:yes gene_type:complete
VKIFVKTQNSRIETDNPKLLKALYELYSFKIPGAEYSTAYKRRNWDGKQHFLSRSGVFKSGLLDSLVKNLAKIDCTPEIIYEDKTTITPKSWDIDGFTYYDYQKDLIELGLKNQRGIVKSPTGSGKTLIMAGLVKALSGRKMVLLFNAKQLLTQSYDFLTKTCGMDNIGLCFGEGYIYGDIMLCTIQSIEKILDTHLDETEVLMIDECHEFANGKTTLPAIRSFPNALYRIGFTATPPNDPIPRNNLEGALGPVWEVVNTSGLVDSGKLTKPLIQLIDRNYDASGVDEDMSYLDVYEEYIVKNTDRNDKIKEIVNDIKNKNKNARILILTKSLDHGRTLEDLLGSNCEFLQGCDSVGERYKAISRFRGHRGSSVLIGTKILQTGVNIEEITHFINARGMKSEIATLQALGRALRKHDSKQEVYVYDFMDKEKYLEDHSRARKRHYEKEGHTVVTL